MPSAPAIVASLIGNGVTIACNDNVADVNGAFWYCEEIDGWDSPAMRPAYVDPTGRHGKAPGAQYYDARALVIRGHCSTPSQLVNWQSRDRLAAASNLLTPGLLVVTETTVAKQMAVLRAGRVRVRSLPDGAGFEFEVPLLAPDPRKYATAATTTALAGTATNAGNIETWPVLSVIGATTNPIQVTLGAKTVRLNIALSGAQTLVADFRAATVLVNGAPRQDVVDSSTRWWPLAPGANVITYSGGGSSRWIDHRSAWI